MCHNNIISNQRHYDNAQARYVLKTVVGESENTDVIIAKDANTVFMKNKKLVKDSLRILIDILNNV